MAKRVLVIDDEPNTVMSLRFLMEREGFEVEVAETGVKACGQPHRPAKSALRGRYQIGRDENLLRPVNPSPHFAARSQSRLTAVA